MKYRFFSLAAAVLTLTLSCGKEELPGGSTDRPAGGETDKPEVLPSLNEGEIAFRASGEFFYSENSDDTDGVMSCFEDGTKASLFTAGFEVPVEMQAVNTQTNAYFVASAEVSKTYFAVYPSSVPHQFESGEEGVSMSVTIPQEQDGSLSAASISVASSTGESARMDFRNICGLLKFSTTSQNIKSVTFRGADDENLVGTVSVSGFESETGEPIFGGISQACKEVKLNIEGRKGVFYLALLPGLTLEKGFLVSFELMSSNEGDSMEEMSRYTMPLTVTRSGCRDLGNVLEYISQLNWFVTATADGNGDGKTWETALTFDQMAKMLSANRDGALSADYSDVSYIETHRTVHAAEIQDKTFHIAAGEYQTANYIRMKFAQNDIPVKLTLKGGYDPDSKGTDLSKRDIANNVTELKGAIGASGGSKTMRVFLINHNVDLTLDGLSLTDGIGDANFGGGAIYMDQPSSTLNCLNCTIANNTSPINSGAIYVTAGSLAFTNCTFSKNTGTGDSSYGGAIYAKNASLTCTGCTFSENSSVNNGGAVWLNAMSKADFINCDFISNECTANLAGAICLSGANPLNITGGTFRANKAAKGGGCLYNNAASIININGTKFIENNSTSVGGGVFYCKETAGPSITISGAEFTNNETAGVGGSLYCLAGTWDITGSTFDANTSNAGGAIYANDGILNITNCTIKNNSSTGAGGALYLSEDAQMTVSGGSLVSNVAVTNGGAAFASCKAFSADDVDFISNKGELTASGSSQGGAIYFANNTSGNERSISNCLFRGNTVDAAKAVNTDYVRGGAVYIQASSPNVVFTTCTFESNKQLNAKDSYKQHGGGAIYATKSFTATGCTFKTNDAYLGGAVATEGGVSTLTSCVFSSNTSGNRGGAVYSKSAASMNFTECDFTSNVSSDNGGACWLTTTGKTTFSDCNFDGNKTEGQLGGAFYINSTGVVDIDGGVIENSYAGGTNGGGAFYISGAAQIDITGTQIKNNKAKNAGGAIWISAAAKLNVDGTAKFSGNQAGTNGGAIYVKENVAASILLNGITFSGNVAKYGAALYTSTLNTIYCNACTFTDNAASNNGTGGVYYAASGTKAYINNSCFHNNDGTKVTSNMSDIVVNGGNLLLMNSTIYEDEVNVVGLRAYNTTTSGQVCLYNNVIQTEYHHAQAGWGTLSGYITSGGYNYTGAWGTEGTGTTRQAELVDSDTKDTDCPVSFTVSSTTDGRGYYTWTKPAEVTGTTAANVTSFLNGITGGSDFATWLGTVDGLTKDIAGNSRPATGWYPGCYQGN